MVIHLIKLAVGARSVEDIARRQRANGPPLRHRTRNMPKRAADLVDGGSLYWVVAGMLAARQRISAIVPATRDDGSTCTDLILEQPLVPVAGRPVKAFQGWRYLEAAAAPADLRAGEAGEAALPESLRRELATLGLL